MAEAITQISSHLEFTGGSELRKAKFQVLAAAPGSPFEGEFYYDSTKKEFGYYTGSKWVYGATPPEAEAAVLGLVELKGDLGGTATSPTVVGLHLSGDTAIKHKLTEVTDPTSAQDAATKNYIDTKITEKINGLSWKAVVTCATQEALPAYTQAGSGATGKLTATGNAILTIDGHKVVLNDDVLVTHAVEEKHNGIYHCTTEGTAGAKYVLTRREDCTTDAQLEGAACFIDLGTAGKGKEYNLEVAGAITVDTTAQKWVEFQSGLAIIGDGSLTTRTGGTIEVIKEKAEPAEPAEGAVTVGAVAVTRIVKAIVRGDAAKTEFTVTHSLGTEHPVVQVYNASKQLTIPGIEATSTSAIKVIFPTAPSKTTLYYVTVMA